MSDHRLDIRRTAGGLSFYIDGSLQFDTRDEHIYHESLVMPAASISSGRADNPLNALILGGGDGLSLRELLKYPSFKKVDLVDYDKDVIDFAGTIFAPWNKNSLSDKRSFIRVDDAEKYLAASKKIYDLIIADFTFPDTLEGCRLFTADFFGLVKKRLSRGGLFALNAVSPEFSSCAYWSIFKTLLELKIYPKPMRVNIPSFLSHGYGEWGSFFASKIPITSKELKTIKLPSARKYMDAGVLLDSLRFPDHLVNPGFVLGKAIHEPSDLLGLLNMSEQYYISEGKTIDFSYSLSSRRMRDLLALRADLLASEMAAEWQGWLISIMRSLDWELFMAEAEKKFRTMSAKTYEEFKRLRKEVPTFLSENIFTLERAYQCFAVLMILIIFINLVYPDNSFAKGGGYGGHGYNSGDEPEITIIATFPPSPFHGAGFRPPNLDYSVPDMRGMTYKKASVLLTDPESGAVVKEQFFYALSDQIFLTHTGHPYLVFPLLPYAYKMEAGGFTLMQVEVQGKLFEFYPDPDAVQSYLKNLELQQRAVDKTLNDYDKWLAWASPARYIDGEINNETAEIKNVRAIREALFKEDEDKKLYECLASSQNPFQAYLIAPGVYLTRDGAILFHRADGQWLNYPYPGFLSVYSGIGLLMPTDPLDRFIETVIRYNISRYPASHPVNILLRRYYEGK